MGFLVLVDSGLLGRGRSRKMYGVQLVANTGASSIYMTLSSICCQTSTGTRSIIVEEALDVWCVYCLAWSASRVLFLSHGSEQLRQASCAFACDS